MIKYEVGTRFPHEKYLGHGEITVAILNEQLFDVLVCLYNVSGEEIKAFRKGKLEVSLYENSHIPFVIFDLGNGFSFDVSIDVTKITEDQQDAWLNSQANTVNLYLVDAGTGNLLAMRLIGIDPRIIYKILDICEEQTEMEPAQVEAKISSILSVISTKDMIRNRILKQEFK